MTEQVVVAPLLAALVVAVLTLLLRPYPRVQRGVSVAGGLAYGAGVLALAARVAGDADTRAAEQELSEALGLKAQIAPGRGEAGELRIAYRTLDQFEEVRRRLLSGGKTAKNNKPSKKTSNIK